MPPPSVRTVTLRGVPIWRLREYLEDMGAEPANSTQPGAADPDGVVRPDGAMQTAHWQVVWRTERRTFHPRLTTTIEEHFFTFSAPNQQTVDAVFDRFMLKAQRGGG